MKTQNLRSAAGILAAALIGAGVALAGSQGSVRVGNLPLFALAVALAFGIQWLAFIPSYLQKTEKFYDLTGSLTYITVTVAAAFLGPARDARTVLLMALVVIWALRLGSFLYLRIKAAGEDRRFREIKTSFTRFLLAWTLQGLWVTFSLAGVLVVFSSELRVDFDIWAGMGLAIWLAGFALEVIADRQKSAFRADPDNAGKFISSGLWSWSRHPNYFGEIVLWVGVTLIALPVLRGWQWVALISPVFITILLTRISGIPMLEERADQKWGGQPEYEAYKARTSVLVPLPPKGE